MYPDLDKSGPSPLHPPTKPIWAGGGGGGPGVKLGLHSSLKQTKTAQVILTLTVLPQCLAEKEMIVKGS